MNESSDNRPAGARATPESAGPGLTDQLRRANSRYDALVERSAAEYSDETQVRQQMLHELSSALEELSVADEELRIQNEALRAAYYEVEQERLHYEELFALIPEAYIVTDVWATILDANRAAESLLGAGAKGLRGKPLVVFVAPEDRRQFRANLNRTTAESGRVEWAATLTPRAMQPVRVLMRVALIRSSEHDQRLGWILRDLTEQDRALTLGHRFAEEQSARIDAERTARRFRALAEVSRLLTAESDDAVLCQSLARSVVRFTGEYCEILAVEGDRLKSQGSCHRETRDSTLIAALRRRHNMTADDPDSLLWRAIRTKQPQVSPGIGDHVDAYSRKDLFTALREGGPRNALAVPLSLGKRSLGVMVVLGSSIVPQLGAEDVGTLLEIATRASLALGNAQLIRELERANREKADFLAILSHELRTPLTAVIGYSDLLLSGTGGPLSERAHDNVERIRACAWHQLSVVEQILKYAHIESGQDRPVLTPVDAGDMIREVTEVVRLPEAESAVKLCVSMPPGSLVVSTDAGRLRQILINLLSNAFKFTDEGTITLTVHRSDDEVFFTVSDTGIGIAAADLERVFDPFWRASPQNTRAQRAGMGLGLAVSGQLARSIGGELTVQSEVGVGTAFTLRLPMK